MVSPKVAVVLQEGVSLLELDTPAAVRSAFALAGYHGPLEVLIPGDDDERLFVVPTEDLAGIGEQSQQLEQVLTELLHLKVAIVPAHVAHDLVPFTAPSYASSGPGEAVLSGGQIAAVRAAFRLAGFNGELRTLPIESDDERIFVIDSNDLRSMGDAYSLEQVVSVLLNRRVLVTDDLGAASVVFE
ncbi:hypothetical protein [Agromyces cerinus]|uniref:hypothetical protein n=1 Tax=Agromyces cerinus TaxID=33878 RepID=UPI000940BDF4|nr:hypothetical protein [Agromyces cerinus]